jgi:hypothetical protein
MGDYELDNEGHELIDDLLAELALNGDYLLD